jgi:hypothetical protein
MRRLVRLVPLVVVLVTAGQTVQANNDYWDWCGDPCEEPNGTDGACLFEDEWGLGRHVCTCTGGVWDCGF